MDIRREVGRRVFYYRYLRNMTQENLCCRTGLTQAYLSSIENGKRKATIDVLDKIAKSLDISLHMMFEHDLSESPPKYIEF